MIRNPLLPAKAVDPQPAYNWLVSWHVWGVRIRTGKTLGPGKASLIKNLKSYWEKKFWSELIGNNSSHDDHKMQISYNFKINFFDDLDFKRKRWITEKSSEMMTMHISRNGGQIIFSIFPHFWYVWKACNAPRCTLLKKMKNNHLNHEIFEFENSRLAIPINSYNDFLKWKQQFSCETLEGGGWWVVQKFSTSL